MTDDKIRYIALLGIILCLLAVVIGAFGAHGFKALLHANQQQDVFELANRYQFYHGLALILIAALFSGAHPKPNLTVVVILMFWGTLIFCSSLYLLALFNVKWLGAVTPIGGVCMIVAWSMLAKSVYMFRSDRESTDT